MSVRSDGLPVWSSLPCSDFLPTCMSVSIRIVLDLQKHDKSGTERAHITQAGLALLTSCIGVFVTINEATLTRKICKSMLYSDCLNFYRNPLQMPHGTWLSRVPSLLLTVSFLDVTVRYSAECPSVGTCLVFSSRSQVFERKATQEKCPFHSVISRVQTLSSTHHWLPALAVWLRDCRVAPRSHSHSLSCTVLFGRESRCAVCAESGGRAPPLRSEGLRGLPGPWVCLFSPFTHSIVYLHHYRLRYFIC